jgi:hypothetical protein
MRVWAFVFCAAAAAFLITCSSPSNPYTNPGNATLGETALPPASSTLDAHSAYPCSVQVILPQYVDTIIVILSEKGAVDTLFVRDSAKSDSPWVAFTLNPSSAGTCSLTIILVRSNGTRDSSSFAFAVQDLSPVAVAVPDTVRGYLGGSVTVRFSLRDPGKKLRSCFFDRQTNDTTVTDTVLNFGINTDTVTVTRTYADSMLFAGLVHPFIIFCQAINDDSLVSARVACTVFVSDTTVPSLVLLADTVDTIRTLPVTIKAIVHDNWGIDSVQFNSHDMTLTGDTALLAVSTLDSGKSIDTVVAFDKGGNSTIVLFPLTYSGHKTYPPHIKDVSKSVNEGHHFDTLFLDTCVTMGNPLIIDSIAYKRDSLDWVITDSNGIIVKTVLRGSPISARKFFVSPPADTEWAGAIPFMFKASTPGGLEDVKMVTYTVAEVADTPQIILGTQCTGLGGTFDTLFLDTCGFDPDNKSSTLSWTFKPGTYFQVDSIITCNGLLKSAATDAGSIEILPPPCFLRFTRRIAIIPKKGLILPTTAFSDAMTFTVMDPTGLRRTKQIIFKQGNCSIKLP